MAAPGETIRGQHYRKIVIDLTRAIDDIELIDEELSELPVSGKKGEKIEDGLDHHPEGKFKSLIDTAQFVDDLCKKFYIDYTATHFSFRRDLVGKAASIKIHATTVPILSDIHGHPISLLVVEDIVQEDPKSEGSSPV